MQPGTIVRCRRGPERSDRLTPVAGPRDATSSGQRPASRGSSSGNGGVVSTRQQRQRRQVDVGQPSAAAAERKNSSSDCPPPTVFPRLSSLADVPKASPRSGVRGPLHAPRAPHLGACSAHHSALPTPRSLSCSSHTLCPHPSRWQRGPRPLRHEIITAAARVQGPAGGGCSSGRGVESTWLQLRRCAGGGQPGGGGHPTAATAAAGRRRTAGGAGGSGGTAESWRGRQQRRGNGGQLMTAVAARGERPAGRQLPADDGATGGGSGSGEQAAVATAAGRRRPAGGSGAGKLAAPSRVAATNQRWRLRR